MVRWPNQQLPCPSKEDHRDEQSTGCIPAPFSQHRKNNPSVPCHLLKTAFVRRRLYLTTTFHTSIKDRRLHPVVKQLSSGRATHVTRQRLRTQHKSLSGFRPPNNNHPSSRTLRRREHWTKFVRRRGPFFVRFQRYDWTWSCGSRHAVYVCRTLSIGFLSKASVLLDCCTIHPSPEEARLFRSLVGTPYLAVQRTLISPDDQSQHKGRDDSMRQGAKIVLRGVGGAWAEIKTRCGMVGSRHGVGEDGSILRNFGGYPDRFFAFCIISCQGSLFTCQHVVWCVLLPLPRRDGAQCRLSRQHANHRHYLSVHLLVRRDRVCKRRLTHSRKA